MSLVGFLPVHLQGFYGWLTIFVNKECSISVIEHIYLTTATFLPIIIIIIINIDQRILKESKERQKKSMAWIDYKKAFEKLDSRLSKNVPYIRQGHKIHHGNHEKLRSRIESRRKNSSRSENPERHLPGRCDFTITTYNSNDDFQSHA